MDVPILVKPEGRLTVPVPFALMVREMLRSVPVAAIEGVPAVAVLVIVIALTALEQL